MGRNKFLRILMSVCLVLVLAIIPVLTACGAQPEDSAPPTEEPTAPPTTEPARGPGPSYPTEVINVKVGEEFTISVYSNPETPTHRGSGSGYCVWTSGYNQKKLELVERTYEPRDPAELGAIDLGCSVYEIDEIFFSVYLHLSP